MKRRVLLSSMGASVASTVFPRIADAQDWPSKPITWVYPYAAGGGADPLARTLAEALGRKLGQSIVVENKTGASGMIGAAAVARAPADGHTFLFCVSGEVVINQWLFKKMPYDPEKDFMPVCRLTTLPLALVTSTATGIKSIEELVERASSSPGKLTFASPGAGTLQHLAGELLQRTAGIKMNHVPYRGIAAATTDLLGGTVDIGFVGLSTALPHVQGGRMHALGLSSATAVAAAPEIKPLAQFSKLKDFDLMQWFGLIAPAGSPQPVVDRMHAELAGLMKSPEVQAKLSAQGLEPAVMSPTEFSAFIRKERERFGKIVRDANITIEQ